jgi:hypothetical protein
MMLALVLAISAAAIAAQFEGTGGPDTIIGTPRIDTIELFAGDDRADGQGRDDFIFGGLDDDTLNGDDGSDVVYG